MQVGSVITYSVYQRLFMKPLMLIGMENALSLIEEHHIMNDQNQTGAISPQLNNTAGNAL